MNKTLKFPILPKLSCSVVMHLLKSTFSIIFSKVRSFILNLKAGKIIQGRYQNIKYICTVLASLYNPNEIKPFFYLHINKKNTFSEDFSQFGQSTLASVIFQLLEINPINYVDIGCNHPKYNNNTYLFEASKGLEGVAIDPQISLKSAWVELRPLTRFLACCCSSKIYLAELSIPTIVEGWEGQLATLDQSTLRNPSLAVEKLPVECKPFTELCGEITHVSFLSIDVESHEHDVLEGINFQKTTFDLICLENCGPLKYRNMLREYLAKKGYVFFARIFYIDDLFVRSSLLYSEFVPSFKYSISPYCCSVISSGITVALPTYKYQ